MGEVLIILIKGGKASLILSFNEKTEQRVFIIVTFTDLILRHFK